MVRVFEVSSDPGGLRLRLTEVPGGAEASWGACTTWPDPLATGAGARSARASVSVVV